jgi:hypothetical protein
MSHRLTHRARFYFCFQQQTIPTYFGNHIVFASFLRKLQRWGFNRRTNRRNERYEFCSPTFKRIGAVVKETGNDGECTSITNPATTNDFPSLVSATVSSVAAVHPTAPSGLPTLAAAAAAPPVPLSEKKPRRAGFRDEFLHRVRSTQKPMQHFLPQSNSNNLFSPQHHPT